MIKICLILFIFFSASGCRQKYEIAYTSQQTSYLVVEGIINTQGPTKVNLSRTTLLSEKGTAYENDAVVEIQGEDNSLNQLVPLDNGMYISDELLLNENVKYRIRIKTKDDRQYVSSFVQPVKTPEIDSITWTRYQGGIEISVNSNDPVNNTTYYKFDYEETWEFKSELASFIYPVFKKIPPGINDVTYGVYDSVNNTYNDSIFTCWQSRKSTNIILGSTSRLTEKKLYVPIIAYPRGSWEFSFLYSINLNQYGISKEGYDFFEKMKKNTESLGSFFDALPSEIPGNVRCVTDTLEKVIGFVDASRLKTKRKFIDNKELYEWAIESSCFEEFIFLRPEALYDRIYVKERLPTRLIYEGQLIIGLATAPKECVDCTLRGVHIKPDFWP